MLSERAKMEQNAIETLLNLNYEEEASLQFIKKLPTVVRKTSIPPPKSRDQHLMIKTQPDLSVRSESKSRSMYRPSIKTSDLMGSESPTKSMILRSLSRIKNQRTQNSNVLHSKLVQLQQPIKLINLQGLIVNPKMKLTKEYTPRYIVRIRKQYN